MTVAGPGVVGIAGGGMALPPDSTVAEVGVAWFGNHGSGVLGVSSDQPGVQGSSTQGAGVAGGSSIGVGVEGSSGRSNGGYFSSEVVAQIHLEPRRKPLADPNGTIEGRASDLLVLLTPKEEQIPTLWFCRTKGDAPSAVWVRNA
jgi:hypothetical protein